MRVLSLFSFLLVFQFSFTNDNNKIDLPPYLYQNNSNWVDSILNQMSIDEKIAQSFFVAANSHSLEETEDFFREVDSLIINYKVGGLIFFRSSPKKIKQLVERYQNISKVPLANSIDGEWGVAMRIDSIQPFPLSMSLGAIQNDSLIFEMGKQIGDELKSLGIHVNFAPVLDINNNPNNPIIGMRSFSESREIVYKKSLKYMLGLQEKNILASGKHFPGHGDTDVDSHHNLPIILHDKTRIDSVELYPFKKLIQSGIGSIMVAHISLPKVDNQSNRPATFSNYIINEILKKELDFQGLVITDALNMKGAYSEGLKPGEIEFNAYMSGNDILLYPDNIYEAVNLIKNAYESNLIDEEEINNRCKKILLMKEWVGLSSNLNNYKEFKINEIEHELLEYKLSKEAITVLKNDNLLPLNNLFNKKIAYVHIGNGSGNIFYNSLNRYMPIDKYNFNDFTDHEKLLKELEKYDVIISAIHDGSGIKPWKSYKPSKKEINFLNKVSLLKPTILNLFTTPYNLNYFLDDNFSSIIISYQNNSSFQELTAQLIFGSIGSMGKLPISCGNYDIGDGIELSKRNIIEFCLPAEVGVNKSSLVKIDSIVNNAIEMKAIPGAQVLASRYGKIFYSKSFGHHTYDSINIVKDTDIYDLASVTKIVAAAPIFMNLMKESKISLNEVLGDFFELEENDIRNEITFFDIFTHQSGLYPWIPFYKSYIDEFGNLNDTVFSQRESDKFNLKVADNLFFRVDFIDSISKNILEYPLLESNDYRYSDLGYYLFNDILTKKKRINIEDYLNDNFFSSIDALRIKYNPINSYSLNNIVPTENDKHFRKQLLKGYVHDPGVALFGGIGLHAGLFSNAIDLAKFMQIYLNKGSYDGEDIFDSYLVNFFTKSHFQYSGNRRGVFFDKPNIQNIEDGPCSVYSSLESFGHSGFTGTLVWVDPKEELIFIFLSNRVHPDQENKLLIDLDVRTKTQSIIYESIIN